MLELHSLSKHFGGVRAVDDLSLTVDQGEIFGLIGPNGSGKSTTVNLICGVFPTTSGAVVFEGRDITDAPSHRVVAAGIGRTFQNIRLFGDLTVWQNLWVAQNSVEERQTGWLASGAAGTMPGSCRNSPASPTARTNSPAISPSASKDAWRWPGRSRPDRNCCCSTNRRRA